MDIKQGLHITYVFPHSLIYSGNLVIYHKIDWQYTYLKCKWPLCSLDFAFKDRLVTLIFIIIKKENIAIFFFLTTSFTALGIVVISCLGDKVGLKQVFPQYKLCILFLKKKLYELN